MALTETAESATVLEALDFDAACCWQRPPCETPATWVYACRSCGNTGLSCAPHKDEGITWAKVFCRKCDPDGDSPGTSTDIFNWYPIGGTP